MQTNKELRKDAIKTISEIHDKAKSHIDNVKNIHDKSKGPIAFNSSTYIYINGSNRPISPTLNSDIIVYLDDGGETVANQHIVPGKKYRIECTVHNGGDLDIPSATVELFCDANAEESSDPPKVDAMNDEHPYLFHLQMVTVNLRGNQSAKISFSWTAKKPEDFLGTNYVPKGPFETCFRIIARAYSFSPRDLPQDWDLLDFKNDRHISCTLPFHVHHFDMVQ